MSDIDNIKEIIDVSIPLYEDKKEELLDVKYANSNSTETQSLSTYNETKPHRITIKCDIKSRD